MWPPAGLTGARVSLRKRCGRTRVNLLAPAAFVKTRRSPVDAIWLTGFYTKHGLDGMGLWANIGGYFEDSHGKYEKDALVAPEPVRQRARSKYGNNRDVLRPKTAEKPIIRNQSVNGSAGGTDSSGGA